MEMVLFDESVVRLAYLMMHIRRDEPNYLFVE